LVIVAADLTQASLVAKWHSWLIFDTKQDAILKLMNLILIVIKCLVIYQVGWRKYKMTTMLLVAVTAWKLKLCLIYLVNEW